MTTIKEAISHYHYGVTHDIFSEPVTRYAKLAIKALEKQIPQKVISEKYFYGYKYFCPSCKLCVNDDFCGNCGQALDWSD